MATPSIPGGPLLRIPTDPLSTLAHVVKRTAFGITPAEWTLAKYMGTEAWVDYQLDYQAIDDSAVEAAIAANLPTVSMTTPELDARVQAGEIEPAQVAAELKAATLYRALYSPRRLYEIMVDFWSNHLNISHQDAPLRLLKSTDDREVIRPNAMGRFRDLLGASAHSPAMLYYLDNHTNTVAGPNENYARELMELHSLGVEGGYTEGDVQEVARCLTGWGISRFPVRGLFRYYPRDHDDGAKSVLGLTIPAGGGSNDGEQVLDLLAGYPSTTAYIALKLCRRLVADNPPDALVQRVADRFSASGGDIRATLEELLYSDEFMRAGEAKLKRPMEYVTSAMGALGAQPDNQGIRTLMNNLRLMGQSPFDWSPPTGYPDVASAWTSTSALINRWNYGISVASGRLPGIPMDYSALTTQANSAEELADLLIDALLMYGGMKSQDRQILVDFIAAAGPRFRERAPAAAGVILSSSYFQYR